MSEFSTFGIGGPIDLFLEVRTQFEMQLAWEYANEKRIPFFVLGKGSNCLFSDAGFRGLVVLNKIDFCHWDEKGVWAGAGYSFSLLGIQSARKGFSGLEFASGIPASVGGAVYMNAGASGSETASCLEEVEVLEVCGNIAFRKKSELTFGYRTSCFQDGKGVVLAARFGLKPLMQARENQLALLDYRLKTQPYKDKSAGCVFRNPQGALSAGALIERCGLKGVQVGGAKVSEMHANFLINTGSATAGDMKALIALVQRRVFEKTGAHLELEIRVVDG